MTESRLIDVLDLPIPLASFGKLAKKYPSGATIRQVGYRFWVCTEGAACWGCVTCTSRDAEDFKRLTGDTLWPTFIVCPDCGNKRCPRASNHDNECTGSNDPGQSGSVYA